MKTQLNNSPPIQTIHPTNKQEAAEKKKKKIQRYPFSAKVVAVCVTATSVTEDSQGNALLFELRERRAAK